MNRIALLLLVIAGAGLVGLAVRRELVRSEDRVETAPAVSRPGTHIDDFMLTERSGRPFHSSSLKGHVWVASFFFASCPSTCVRQNEVVARLQEEYGNRGVKFVSITCDPENDTPERLREYAAKFQARPDQWFFLTGDLTYIRLVGQDAFQVPVAKQTHANRLMLVDQNGKLCGSFNWNEARQLKKLREKIESLLAGANPT